MSADRSTGLFGRLLRTVRPERAARDGAVVRRLAAILSADMVGYSRLMGLDEAGTLAALRNFRRELIDPKIAAHRGRIVKTTGDGLLVEFASVVDAVQCAIEVQNGMPLRAASEAEEKRITFRIGVNLGEIIFEGGDIYGDGVNIAARLEQLAQPGGVCISHTVYKECRGRIDASFGDGGERELKNIAKPVHVWHWQSAPGIAAAPQKIEIMEGKPSIAVLPFVNMSEDKSQEYFAEGIAEDIIVALSKLHSLFVVARNTSFAFKEIASQGRNLGKELGARYIVRGSVRKVGQRARITAQLIDSETERQLWAESYDRELGDVFLVQDEITGKIISILPSRIEAADLKRTHNKSAKNLAAYEYLLRGKYHHHLRTQSDNEIAHKMLSLAVEADPGSAQAHAWRACVIGQAMVRGYRDDANIVVEIMQDLQTALALDNEDFECHRVLSSVYGIQKNYDRAEFHAIRAFELNPNDPRVISQYGELLALIGRPEDGVEMLKQALLVDPYSPDDRLTNLGFAQFAARRYDDALSTFRKISSLTVKHHAYLAACYAQLGDMLNAGRQTVEVHRLNPAFSVEDFVAQVQYKIGADRQHHIQALRKAGL